jgi:hypothetical protein
MKKIIEKYLIFTIILALNFLSSCKREEVTADEKNIFIDKYTLEIDNNYIIYQVSLSSYDSRRNFIIEYSYSPKTITKTVTYSGEPGTRVSTFYINISGFADSSKYSFYYNGGVSSPSTSYFIYDSNNYLKMDITKRTDYAFYKPDTTFYDYDNGNMIKYTYSGGIFGVIYPTSCTYTYNSIKNFIDIKSFTGVFIGKLNQNLIASVTSYGSPEGTKLTRCQYILNSDGLVEERTSISSQAGQSTVLKLVDKFEYKIR